MKQYVLSLLLMLVFVPFAKGQKQVFLSLEGGPGIGLYRDLGTSPITYRGYEFAPCFALRYESPKWQLSTTLGGFGGGYSYQPTLTSMQNYGGIPAFAISALRRIVPQSPVCLWVGINAEEAIDIRYFPSLGNTSTSFSNFVNVNILGKAEYTLSHFLFQTQLTFAPASLCLRPGFAYLDNFNQDISNPITNTFDQYEWYLTAFNQVSTSLAASYILPHGNRIGLSYRWHYLTSRTSALAPYRFEQANHAILLTLDLLLN